MEGIGIPNVSGILLEARNVIDRPATLAEYMNAKCNEDRLVQSIEAVKNILTKLDKHQKLHGDDATDDPSSLVKAIAMVIKDIIDNKLNTGFINRVKSKISSAFVRNRCMKSKETIDDSLRNDLEEKKRSLFELTKEHTQLVDDIRQAKKDCFTSKSKKNKAELILYTALLKRTAEHKAEDAKSRDLVIQELKISLAIEEQRQDICDLTFQKLILKEERMCIDMEKISQEIKGDINAAYTRRWERAVSNMKQLSEEILPSESQSVILEKVAQLDIQAVLTKIIAKNQCLYTIANCQEFKRVNILNEIKGRH